MKWIDFGYLSTFILGCIVGYVWGRIKSLIKAKKILDEFEKQVKDQINELKVAQKTYQVKSEDYDEAIKFFYSQEH